MLRQSAVCLGGRALAKGRKAAAAAAATALAPRRGRPRKLTHATKAALPAVAPLPQAKQQQHMTKAQPLHEMISLVPLQSTQGLRDLETSLAVRGELGKAMINALARLPPQAHLVLLDCTHSHTPGHEDRVVSAMLIAHIHHLLQAYVTRVTRAGELTTLRRLASCPLLVLVRTRLSREDAEVQQWVLRNALRMQPVQGPFATRRNKDAMEEPMVWVMDATESAQLAASSLLAQYGSVSFRVSAAGEIEASADPTTTTTTMATVQAKKAEGEASEAAGTKKAAEQTSVSTATTQKPAKAVQTDITTTTITKKAVIVSKVIDTKAPAKAATGAATGTQKAEASNEDEDAELKAAVQAASEAVQRAQASLAPAANATSAQSITGVTPIETEKELWRSRASCPVRLSVLRSLLSAEAYTALEHKLAAKPGSLHILVYRVGTYSTVQSTWRSCLEGVRTLYAQLTGRALDDVRFFMTATQPSSLLANAATTTTTEGRRSRSRRGGRRHASEEGSAAAASQQQLLSSATTMNSAPRIVLLVHGNHLTSDDAAVFAAGLQEQYSKLTAEVQGDLLLAVQLLPAQRITERSLMHLLNESTQAATPSLFAEVYERLAANKQSKKSSDETTTAAATTTTTKKEEKNEGSAEALVRQSVWVAAMLQTLLRRHEAALRTEFDASVGQMRQQQADNEELARAAQKVEFKAMMIDAVEEVSLRHEQATAHLVKTLSSMVGQWSAEKFLDGLEAVIKEQLKPMQAALESLKKTVEEEGKAVWNECAEEIAEAQEMIGEAQKAVLDKMAELDKAGVQRGAEAQAAQHQASAEAGKQTLASLQGTVSEAMQTLKEEVKPLIETSVEHSVRAALSPAAQDELQTARLEKCIEVAVGRVWRRLRLGRYVVSHAVSSPDRGSNKSNTNNTTGTIKRASAHGNGERVVPLSPVPLPPLPSEVLTAPVTPEEMQQMLLAALKPIQQTMQREVRECVRGEAAQAVAAALQQKGSADKAAAAVQEDASDSKDETRV